MKSIGRRAAPGPSGSSIFGSTAILSDTINTEEPFRIAVYPIISDTMPDLAMGIASCLCYLLEQWPGVKVYRCFVKIEADEEDNDITSDDYQFSPADWELDGLDDNLVLYGSATFHETAAQLQLHADASMVNAEADSVLTFNYQSVPELIEALPTVAAEIVSNLFDQEPLHLVIDYPKVEQKSAALQSMLEDLFAWNLDLYLSHWGVEWPADEIESQFLSLAGICREIGTDFTLWCLGMTCQQIMQLGLEELGEVIVPLIDRAFGDEGTAAQGRALAALGLSRLGHVDPALTTLEELAANSAEPSVWHTLIEVTLDAGRAWEAIDVCQRALETGVQHPALYWKYAELLIMSEANNWLIEDVLFVDPDEIDESDQIPCEIVGALKTLLETQPDHLQALQLALMYMVDVEDLELWDYFEQLVKRDDNSTYVGEIIERLADTESLTPAYQILQNAIVEPVRNPYLYANLAQLAIVDGNPQMAKEQLQECRRVTETIDDELELELQRLELSADRPGFEGSFAEIKVLLNAKRSIRESDAELLEEAIEIAPRMIDLYVTLSRCYLSWQDKDSAIEVLSEAKNRAGNHPRIVLGMAQIQWTLVMRDEAILTLNAGIAEFPNDVSLLAQTASYLIENGQLDDAKQFVERAESIAPSHGALIQLRRFIAANMSSQELG
ncbi:MAG: hypothetical protein OXG39_03025 [Chloroflexi bacterium]|nr:hypothetical protein [Chloroflexota bacterium]